MRGGGRGGSAKVEEGEGGMTRTRGDEEGSREVLVHMEEAGTRLKVEGDLVMADADKNPKRRAQGQRRGRGEMGRPSTGARAGAEGVTGQRDVGRIVGTASSVRQNEKLTGCSSGMGYCDGAEHKVVTKENSWR